ncbi:MAG: Xaa-Pro peptidase family protein [Actinomycetota bacterium]
MANLVFPAEEFEARVEDVRKVMRGRGVEALLITSPENIYYLVGLSHQGYFAFTMLVFPVEGQLYLVTRSMERLTVTEQARQVEHVGFTDQEEPWTAVVEAVERTGLSTARVGVELDNMFFPPLVWEMTRDGLPGVEWINGSGVVEQIRMLKSPLEIESIQQAAALSDRAIRSGIGRAGVGMNEREVAAEVMRSMILGGSEHPGFVPLVRSKRYLLHEHTTWRDSVLRAGDGLFMELSASINRYHAPLARIAYLGRPPTGVEHSAQICQTGLDAVCEALKPGVTSGQVYEAWQAVIDDALGPGVYARHHCGYSVGIGFPPSWVGGATVIGLRPAGTVHIRATMVFHVLSWLLGTELPDYVLSDTVLVTETGGELLTTTRRRPIVIN